MGNAKRTKIIVINLGWEQEPLLDELNKLNIEIFGVHYNDDYYKNIKYSNILICDIRDINSILNFAIKINPDAVISDQCDYSHFAQAIISDYFNIPGPSVNQSIINSNKIEQRILAKQKGIKIPDFKPVKTINDIYDFAQKYDFPIIIKPADNRGSFGISKIANKEQIKEAFFNAITNSHSRLCIVEQFINGQEITIDGYCFNKTPKSLALATKGKIKTKQISVDIKYPGDINKEIYDKAMLNNEHTIKALEYTFGMTHAEYIIDKDNNIYLVEAANRGGGVYTSEVIVPNVSGINILKQYIYDTLGEKITISNNKIEQNEVILKFFNFKSGKIKEISGLESLEDKSVLKSRLTLKKGDIISSISNDANRHGFIIVKDNNNVRKKASEIMKQIIIKYQY